jgi:hypothetical protein
MQRSHNLCELQTFYAWWMYSVDITALHSPKPWLTRIDHIVCQHCRALPYQPQLLQPLQIWQVIILAVVQEHNIKPQALLLLLLLLLLLDILQQ